MRIAVLLAALFLSLGSAPEPVYKVRRSALVPHPTPPGRTGRPPSRRIEFSARNSTILIPIDPVADAGANAGLYVARTNAAGAMRLKMGTNWDLALLAEYGFAGGAMRLAEDPRPRNWRGGTGGMGMGLGYSAPLDGDHLRLGFSADVLVQRIPYHEEGTCIANCEFAALSYVEDGSHTILIGSLGLYPNYQRGKWTVYGGLTYRNHPTNTATGTQTMLTADNDREVSSGPGYLLVGAGLELTLSPVWRVHADVFQPLTSSPVSYGPAVGLGLSASVGE